MLLHLWDFPGKRTGVGCHILLQEIFLTQGTNPGLRHCRQMLYHLSHQGSLSLSSVKEGTKEPDPGRSSRKRTRRAKVGQKLDVCSRNRLEGMSVDCLTKCQRDCLWSRFEELNFKVAKQRECLMKFLCLFLLLIRCHLLGGTHVRMFTEATGGEACIPEAGWAFWYLSLCQELPQDNFCLTISLENNWSIVAIFKIMGFVCLCLR